MHIGKYYHQKKNNLLEKHGLSVSDLTIEYCNYKKELDIIELDKQKVLDKLDLIKELELDKMIMIDNKNEYGLKYVELQLKRAWKL